MIRNFATLVLTLLTLGLAGCGGAIDPTTPAPAASSSSVPPIDDSNIQSPKMRGTPPPGDLCVTWTDQCTYYLPTAVVDRTLDCSKVNPLTDPNSVVFCD
jgi:hypothetical protein